MRGRFRSDTAQATYAAVQAGLGIGFTLYWQVAQAVEQGEFELVLGRFEPPPIPVRLV